MSNPETAPTPLDHISPWDTFTFDSQETTDATSKQLDTLLQLSPAEQLKSLVDLWERAEADTWYAVGDYKDIFYAIDGDSRFSPFIQVVAKAAKTSDPNDPSTFEHKSIPPEPEIITEEYGYDSIVFPEELLSCIDPDFTNLTESELKEKLDQAKNADAEAPPPGQFDDWSSYELALESALANIYYKNNQAKLHAAFPSLPTNGDQLVKIASDAAISVDFQKKYSENDWFEQSGTINVVSNSQGQSTSKSAIENNTPNPLGLDKEMLTYLETVHCKRNIKKVIELNLGLSLSSIPIDSQIQLLKYMTTADSSQYASLCTTLANTPSTLRQKLAESFFLVSNLDQDFGTALLDVANSSHITDDHLDHLLDNLNSCHSSIDYIAGLYQDFDDGLFSKQYSHAANERLTDILFAFREIGKTGSVSLDLEWPDHLSFNLESALEALDYEEQSLSLVSHIMDDIISGKNQSFAEKENLSLDNTFSSYRFYSPDYGYTRLYVRSEGSGRFNPDYEYGKFRSLFSSTANNSGVEASISFTVDPVNPRHYPNPRRPDHRAIKDPNFYDPTTMNKVSPIRLDREGRSIDTPANSPLRDPIKEEGIASNDLAAINDRADTPSGKIARLIAIGNYLRHQGQFSLNHNTSGFDHDKYGTATGFKRLAHFIQTHADALCYLHPPTKEQSSKHLRRILKAPTKHGKKIYTLKKKYP